MRLAWPKSPTRVIEPDGQRRASMRHCIAVRSCASSTSTCPYVRSSPSSSPTGARRVVAVALEHLLGADRSRPPRARRPCAAPSPSPRRSRPRRRRRGRAALCGPRIASASSSSGRSASVHCTSRTSGDPVAEQQPLLVGREHVLRRRADERLEPEQVVHQLGAARGSATCARARRGPRARAAGGR